MLRKQPAPRALTELERQLPGTWIAKVSRDAPQSAATHGKVMLQLPPGRDLVAGRLAGASC